MDWLVGCAVRLEYSEKAADYNNYVGCQGSATPKLVSDNPLDCLDFSSPEFKSGVESLADKLKVNIKVFTLHISTWCCRSAVTRTTWSHCSPSVSLSPAD